MRVPPPARCGAGSPTAGGFPQPFSPPARRRPWGRSGRWEEAGLSIPEDVSLVSFNDTPLSELVTPALTSVSTHVEEMSRTAVRLLAERARVPGRPPVRTLPVKVVVPPSLVCRESVGVPAK